MTPLSFTIPRFLTTAAGAEEDESTAATDSILNQTKTEDKTRVACRMEEHYESGYRGLKPNSIAFSLVINAWSTSRDPAAPQKAEALQARTQKMHEAGDDDVKPNTVVVTTVLSTWASSGDRDAGIRANVYLAYMKNIETLGHKDCGPNNFT